MVGQTLVHVSAPKWARHLAFVLSIGTVRVWHSNTYRLENTLNYGMERVWCICGQPGSNSVAIGFDEGSIIIKVVIFVVFSQIF